MAQASHRHTNLSSWSGMMTFLIRNLTGKEKSPPAKANSFFESCGGNPPQAGLAALAQ
jgi:hypothetical protein